MQSSLNLIRFPSIHATAPSTAILLALQSPLVACKVAASKVPGIPLKFKLTAQSAECYQKQQQRRKCPVLRLRYVCNISSQLWQVCGHQTPLQKISALYSKALWLLRSPFSLGQPERAAFASINVLRFRSSGSELIARPFAIIKTDRLVAHSGSVRSADRDCLRKQ